MSNILNWIENLLATLRIPTSEFILLVAVISITVIVIDNFHLFYRRRRKEFGVPQGAQVVSVDGSKSIAVREYISSIQYLSGRPDALILEHGYIIPVERKPNARKLRDRHIAQLLVYMRLVEEFEGQRPPYGYLVLGQKARVIKIENSAERQAWLSKILEQMQAALKDNNLVEATPEAPKCRTCSVKATCTKKTSH